MSPQASLVDDQRGKRKVRRRVAIILNLRLDRGIVGFWPSRANDSGSVAAEAKALTRHGESSPMEEPMSNAKSLHDAVKRGDAGGLAARCRGPSRPWRRGMTAASTAPSRRIRP
jgi:hypothetical protein